MPGRRLTVALAAAVIVVIAGGAYSAHAVGQHLAGGATSSPPTPSPTSTPRTTVPTGPQATPAPTPGATPDATPDSTPGTTTRTTPPPTSTGSDSATVTPPSPAPVTIQLSPAADQSPRAPEIRVLLQRYFDAINNRDYDAWALLVSAGQVKAQSPTAWQHNYATTTDSNIRVTDITEDPLAVRLWFTSRQDPSLAPKDLPVACINWDVTYTLASQDGRLLVDTSEAAKTSKVACG